MGASKKTKKLGLSLWQSQDRPQREDFVADNQALETFLAGHLDDSIKHLSTAQKAFLNRPVWDASYTGNGKESRSWDCSKGSVFGMTICVDHQPVEVDEDGAVHYYWGMWSRWNPFHGGLSIDLSAGLLRNYQKTENGVVFHLNEKGLHYVTVVFLSPT